MSRQHVQHLPRQLDFEHAPIRIALTPGCPGPVPLIVGRLKAWNERQRSPLSYVDNLVLQAFAVTADYATGRSDATISYVQRLSGCARSAVFRSRDRLVALGFLAHVYMPAYDPRLPPARACRHHYGCKCAVFRGRAVHFVLVGTPKDLERVGRRCPRVLVRPHAVGPRATTEIPNETAGFANGHCRAEGVSRKQNRSHENASDGAHFRERALDGKGVSRDGSAIVDSQATSPLDPLSQGLKPDLEITTSPPPAPSDARGRARGEADAAPPPGDPGPATPARAVAPAAPGPSCVARPANDTAPGGDRAVERGRARTVPESPPPVVDGVVVAQLVERYLREHELTVDALPSELAAVARALGRGVTARELELAIVGQATSRYNAVEGRDSLVWLCAQDTRIESCALRGRAERTRRRKAREREAQQAAVPIYDRVTPEVAEAMRRAREAVCGDES
jgi:hypothetical protein